MLEREPLAHTLAAVFLAAKTEDEFVLGGRTRGGRRREQRRGPAAGVPRFEGGAGHLERRGLRFEVAHPHGAARALTMDWMLMR